MKRWLDTGRIGEISLAEANFSNDQADDWSSLHSQFYGESVRQRVQLERTDMVAAATAPTGV